MKKGLAIIYDPHNVYQFLWYYCTYGKDIEWYALCLPNSYKGEYLSQECKKLDIFNQIFTDSIPFDTLPLGKKFSLFLKLFFYALIGKQKKIAGKIISSYIKDLEFDTAVILTDVGFISGLFCLFGKEKEIVILEDGMGDYIDRKYSNIFSHFHNFFDIQGFLMSILGYSNTGHFFPLRTTKNCIKFSSHPEKMKYKKYKTMNALFDMTYTDISLFKKLISILYPSIEDFFSADKNVILFTTPISDYVTSDKKYLSLIENYINNNFTKIIIKRHPRDKAKYNFSENVQVTEIPQSIPAEVLLPYLGQIKILFCEISSTNLYMTPFGYSPSFFYFDTLLEDNKKEKETLATYLTKKEFQEKIDFFGFGKNVISL